MVVLIAMVRRFFHCLVHLHRSKSKWIVMQDERKLLIYVGCECGRTFWSAFAGFHGWHKD